LGKNLSLTQQELLVIETKYLVKDSLKECFYQMLLRWRLKEPENCYFEFLYKKSTKFIKCKISSDDEIFKKRFDCYFKRFFKNFENIDEIKMKNVRKFYIL
jgi:hypothetical protein